MTQLSLFWFKYLSKEIPNHLYTGNTDFVFEKTPNLKNRSMVVRQLEAFKAEFIVRGYLAGSSYNEYMKNDGCVCGIKLENGLRKNEKLQTPILTPTTKAEIGQKDLNLTHEETIHLIGLENFKNINRMCITIFKKASELALKKGIIIVDTKMEFGIDKESNQIYLIDEVLTPDCSRFWDLDEYNKGNIFGLDKQYIRDYLTENNLKDFDETDNNVLPADVIIEASRRYELVYQKLIQ